MKSPSYRPSEEMERLLISVIDGDLTNEESDQLEELLQEDSEAQRFAVDFLQLNALMQWHSVDLFNGELNNPTPGESDDSWSVHLRADSNSSASPPISKINRLFRHWTLAACIVVGLGWTASSFFSFPQSEPAPVFQDNNVAGRVVNLANVAWSESAQQHEKWSRLSFGESIQFDAGVVELMLDNGAQIVLEGPADFRLVSPMKAVAQRGKLIVRCGPDAVGYEVESPHANVVDLGTEFGVTVVEGQRTDVVVYEGAVDLSTRTGELPQERHLTAGEALYVDLHGEVERIMSVHTDGFRMPRDLLNRNSGRSSLIRSVSDNLQSADTTKYYRIVGNGFGEDCRAFVDRDYQWNGVDSDGLPSFLLGGDYVMTFNDDKIRTLEIDVELVKPASVYVLLDNRVTVPEWLKRDFVDTGRMVGLDEANPHLRRDSPNLRPGQTYESALKIDVGPGRSVDSTFSVWRRDYAEASTAKLGPIRQQSLDVVPHAVLENMYGIVVTNLRDSELGSVY